MEDSLLAELCTRNKNCYLRHPFVTKHQNPQNKTNIDEDIQNEQNDQVKNTASMGKVGISPATNFVQI